MTFVRPKKHLGQHFLNDKNIARKIVASLINPKNILEVGPGMGILTEYLLEIEGINLFLIEIDRESVEFLKEKYPKMEAKIIQADFLKFNSASLFEGNYAVIGNFPYNISSQILFNALENRTRINEVIGMFQKEVAERISAQPGNKTYGILSVLLNAFYSIEYLFTVNESVFTPPPKVKSAVIRLTRNNVINLDCDEKLFFAMVKKAFNQRRKTLRNALSSYQFNDKIVNSGILSLRAERLSTADFIDLCKNTLTSN